MTTLLVIAVLATWLIIQQHSKKAALVPIRIKERNINHPRKNG